jgi:hypothetical protein
MIIEVLGWKFETLKEANDAVTRINNYYGVPYTPNSTTKDYAFYVTMPMFGTEFYYMVQSDDLQVVLGEPWLFIIDAI